MPSEFSPELSPDLRSAMAERLPGGEKIVGAAEKAAHAMESAADYVRNEDWRVMLADVRQLARRNPGATLAIAAGIGFLLMRKLMRD
jgi:ElaB/YqjD/DUF883 family membrane-anchored ribosome-binding protein